jgi:tRNA nucleotidyltransferase (CCA-adding enzyme)
VAMDPMTGDLFDPHGGQEDIKNGVLRATDPGVFDKDPVRVLRSAQFAARHGMSVHPETMSLMQDAVHRLSEQPRERIGGEWHKLVMKGEIPSRGLEIMKQTGALRALHPELDRLSDTPLASGSNAWEHTKQSADRAAEITKDLHPASQHAVRYAALLHNVGRALTTTKGEGGVKSKGHGAVGAKLADKMMREQFWFGKVGDVKGKDLAERTKRLIHHQSVPHELFARRNKVSDADIHRLALALDQKPAKSKTDKPDAASIEELVHLTHATHPDEGRSPAAEWLHQRAQGLGVLKEPIKPLISGKHLKDLGIPSGRHYQRIIDHVYDRQMNGEVTNEEEAKKAAQEHWQQSQPTESITLFDRVFFA